MAQQGQPFLEPVHGGLVLAAYALILALAGVILTDRRDVA